MKEYTLRKSFTAAIQTFALHPLHLYSKLWGSILLTSVALCFAIYTCVNYIVIPASALPLTNNFGYIHNVIYTTLHLEALSWLKIALSMLIFLIFNSIMHSAFLHYEIPGKTDFVKTQNASLLNHIKVLTPQALKHFILSVIRLLLIALCIIGIFYSIINTNWWTICASGILLIVFDFTTYHANYIWKQSPTLSLHRRYKAIYSSYRPHIGQLTVFSLIYRPIILCMLLLLFLPTIVTTIDYFFDNVAIFAGENSGLPTYFAYIYVIIMWVSCCLITWIKMLFLLPTRFLLPQINNRPCL